MISGSVENLLLSRRSVVGVRWVGGGHVVQLLVGGLVEHLLLGGRLSVVGCLSVIRGFVICQFTYAAILCANFNK